MNGNIRHYELMCIISTRIPEKNIESKKNSIKKKIEKISTKITAFIDMGVMNLAYKIRSHLKGYYIVITFNADSSVIPDLKSELSLDTELLRLLLIKIPNDHVLSEDSKIVNKKDISETSSKSSNKKDTGVKKIRKRVVEKKLKEKAEKDKKDQKDQKKNSVLDNKVNKKKLHSSESNDNIKNNKQDINKHSTEGDYATDKIDDLSKKIDDLLSSI